MLLRKTQIILRSFLSWLQRMKSVGVLNTQLRAETFEEVEKSEMRQDSVRIETVEDQSWYVVQRNEISSPAKIQLIDLGKAIILNDTEAI